MGRMTVPEYEAMMDGMFEGPKTAPTEIRIVDVNGNPIGLTPFQKNELYAKAKALKEQILDHLLTRTQLWDAKQENVQKYLQTEGSETMIKKQEEYMKLMQVIGADKGDMNLEKLRKAR